MLLPDTNTTDYTPLEAGTYPARCVALLDLGMQMSAYEGETKAAHKVLVQFEILDTEARRSDGTPFVVSKRFTLSKHEKSALRGFLQGQIADSPQYAAIPNKSRSIAVVPTPSPAPAVPVVAPSRPAMAPVAPAAAHPAPPAYATEFAPFGDEDIPF